jgi:hypothetical protein
MDEYFKTEFIKDIERKMQKKLENYSKDLF